MKKKDISIFVKKLKPLFSQPRRLKNNEEIWFSIEFFKPNIHAEKMLDRRKIIYSIEKKMNFREKSVKFSLRQLKRRDYVGKKSERTRKRENEKRNEEKFMLLKGLE